MYSSQITDIGKKDVTGGKRKGTISPVIVNRCTRGTDPGGELLDHTAALRFIERKWRRQGGEWVHPNYSDVFQCCGIDT